MHAASAVGVPFAAALLDDAYIAVPGRSLKLLENWSGQKCGATLTDTVQVESKTTGLQEFQAEGVTQTKAAAENAKAWWAEHLREFPPEKLEVPPWLTPSESPFRWRNLSCGPWKVKRPALGVSRQGGAHEFPDDLVHCLCRRDARARGVAKNAETTLSSSTCRLIMFLTNTVTSAVARRSRNKNTLTGIMTTTRQPLPHSSRCAKKVVRTAKARNVNLPVLLDEYNEVGGRYNRGELPTSVIVDTQGYMRRRFINARNIAVSEAMIAEVAQPPTPSVNATAASSTKPE